MEKLSNIVGDKTFELPKTQPPFTHFNFFYAKETFVDGKGRLLQNCNCGKCSDCFRTPNNLKNFIGMVENVKVLED